MPSAFLSDVARRLRYREQRRPVSTDLANNKSLQCRRVRNSSVVGNGGYLPHGAIEELCNDDSSATVQIPVFPGDRCNRYRYFARSLLPADRRGAQATG